MDFIVGIPKRGEKTNGPLRISHRSVLLSASLAAVIAVGGNQ